MCERERVSKRDAHCQISDSFTSNKALEVHDILWCALRQQYFCNTLETCVSGNSVNSKQTERIAGTRGKARTSKNISGYVAVFVRQRKVISYKNT